MLDAFERVSVALPMILDGHIKDAVSKCNGKSKKSGASKSDNTESVVNQYKSDKKVKDE